MNFRYRAILKPSNINLASVFVHVRKKLVEFTDSTNTIYWPTNITKKAANCWKKIFLFMSGLNTFQYKQCLCTLTLSKCNEQFIDLVCIIYRPKEKNSKE